MSSVFSVNALARLSCSLAPTATMRSAKRFQARLNPMHRHVVVQHLLLAVILLASCFIALQHVASNAHSTDVCLLLGTNPSAHDLWQFSARSLCVSSSICFDPTNPGASLHHSSDLSRTKCHIYNPDFTPSSQTFPPVATMNRTLQTCRSFQHHFVHCAHGTHLGRAMPTCPELHPLLPTVRSSAQWIEGVSVVVPDYAFSRNIYHYVNPIADLVRTVENLPTLLQQQSSFPSATSKVNILFQGARSFPLAHAWKQQILELMITQRILNRGIDVNLYFMEDFKSQQSHVCLRHAVLLGRRGHFNVWPFPNKTDVPLHGFSVPLDAVRFKQAVYDGVGVDARLPQYSEAQTGYSFSEPPPFALGYARREGKPGSDGYYRGGAMRKFSGEDEEWFVQMLRNETDAFGAKFIIISAKKRESLKEQVLDVIQVGFLVGIHGANLVNGLFMHPFGALMEIMPKNATEECYIGGANSGLKYLRMESSEEVSLLDSGCHPRDFLCKIDPRQRGIRIRLSEDRRRIRLMVRQGLEHLRLIRTRFPDGIRVAYNSSSMYYDVND